MSPKQMSDREKFTKTFPSIERIFNFFQPTRWEYVLRHTDECLTFPCVALADIDETYHTERAAQRIVQSQFIGVYSLTTAREQYNEQASSLAAEMFVGRYGHACSLYDLMLYFAGYLTEYKQSYRQYDVQDILIQYSRKYLPWKRMRLQLTDSTPNTETKGIPLDQVILKWVREGRTDESFREGGLYHIGIITDQMIEKARNQQSAELASGCF